MGVECGISLVFRMWNAGFSGEKNVEYCGNIFHVLGPTMAPTTVSPQISHPLDSRPYSPATSSSNLQAVIAQKVAPASSQINAFRSWGTKHYTTKSCAIAAVPLPKPEAAYLPNRSLFLHSLLFGHSKCALKPLSSAHKQNLSSWCETFGG